MIQMLSSPHEIIHCIGDSHVSFFSGTNSIQPLWPEPSVNYLPFFKTYRLGAVLAYNLCENDTRMRGREKLFTILESEIPKGSKVLLCFGEIDCRVHLLNQAELQKRPLESVIAECVDRYLKVVNEIIELGYDVIVYNVIPSSSSDTPTSSDYVSHGTCYERNVVTNIYNNYLRKCLIDKNIGLIYFFDKLIDNQGLTKDIFYMDKTHLSQIAMPLAIESIKDVDSGISFDLPIMYKIKLINTYICSVFTKLNSIVKQLLRLFISGDKNDS